MRKWVLLIAITITMAAFAGCLGGGSEGPKENPTGLVLKHGTVETMSGWINEDGNEHASQSFPITLNDTNIVSVKFTISVEDSDPEHSETDEGSNSDDITVTITGNNETETKQGPTPLSATIEFKSPQGLETPVYLSSSWNIQIDAELGGGKPMFIFGRIVYIDQGIAYKISGDYSYMAEEITV
jgi:hypothetical protein